MNLPQDGNGFYHLKLYRNKWQTLHRVSGNIQNIYGDGVENFLVQWKSDLYWYLGDTLGYIIDLRFNSSTGLYVSIDTSYIVGFTGAEVMTSNRVSYSNSDGDFHNMVAPVKSMIGDTLYLNANWFEGQVTWGIVLE